MPKLDKRTFTRHHTFDFKWIIVVYSSRFSQRIYHLENYMGTTIFISRNMNVFALGRIQAKVMFVLPTCSYHFPPKNHFIIWIQTVKTWDKYTWYIYLSQVKTLKTSCPYMYVAHFSSSHNGRICFWKYFMNSKLHCKLQWFQNVRLVDSSII